MGKRPTDAPPEAPMPGRRAVAPDAALAEALRIMLPLVAFLLRSGVPYGAFVDALKTVFVDAARRELLRDGMPVTQSSLSVLSGVHRKDVRVLAGAEGVARGRAAVSLAAQVFARWIGDAAYARKGKPRALPRSGPRPSFESLSREVSQDVHPRTLLEELLRLGAVRFDDAADLVTPLTDSFVPSSDMGELLSFFSANLADHLSAGTHNLTGTGDRFLERSVFATGLSEESVCLLAKVAHDAWAKAYAAMVEVASERVARDQQDDSAVHRMRFGAFFYSEPQDAGVAQPPQGQKGSSE